MALKPIQQNHEAKALDLDGLEIMEPLCAVFRRHLKGLGQKYTPERAQILDTLIRLDDIFEAEQLQRELKDSGFRVSKATIYRTIKLLLDAGIIQRVLAGSDHAHYQLAYGRRQRDQIVRLDTKEIIPVDVPELAELREAICAKMGLHSQGHRLQIFATGD